MKRSMIAVMVAAALLLVAGQAMAQSASEASRDCVVLPEHKTQVAEIIEGFQARMQELRDRIAQLRGTGSTDAIQQIHDERVLIHRGKIEAMAPYVREDALEAFLDKSLARARRTAQHTRLQAN